ncbi:MAG TPA: hypothetical protein VFH80_09675 [Solirubrobacteraceae bacterium]|nr:hypothetical protein [Solirubrobacteraceae bacterium]
MPLRNRVTPLGELVATPERGLVYGNRGCLHDEQGEIRRRYATQRWIACRLSFRGRRRSPLMAPGRFTELFFLDEATALAAGHRPCAECRRSDYTRFCDLWLTLHPGQIGADAIDAQLHGERIAAGTRERLLHESPYSKLPDGAFVLEAGRPQLVLARQLLAWSPGGYLDRHRRPSNGRATVITPPSLMAILRSGWCSSVPLLHPSSDLAPR